ncbi:MAG TPA: hypothetical protein VJQ53_07720 [Candidatus Eisenbacteria bacterium]|nr:hypothetical protein [Candidatus Eisenbacteria bacterium]
MISAYLTAVIPALVLPWLLLPLRNTGLFAIFPVLPAAVVYARLIRERRAEAAITVAMVWALAITISTVAASAAFSEAATKSIWHAGAFRDEMLAWIATGRGAEGNPAIFLPRVLVEYALVLILSAVSMGVAALFLGGLLLGYMNGYVGWVVSHADPSASPIIAAVTAWPPWSVCRVLSFIFAGTAGALWGHPRILARGAERAPVCKLLIWSATLLLADIGLKWWLAPIWRDFLRALLGASAGIEAGGNG